MIVAWGSMSFLPESCFLQPRMDFLPQILGAGANFVGDLVGFF
jgi:hypothetical protein